MDNLRLDIEWEVNEHDLKASMDRSKKAIEGVGQTSEQVEQKVHKNISNVAKGTEVEIQRVQTRIAQLNADLERWTNPKTSTLALDIDHPSLQRYKKELADLEAQLNKLRNAPIVPKDIDNIPPKVAQTKMQFNGLQNSINQISRELPAFTYSAQTGFLAISNNIPMLADEINKIKAQNDALVASGQKGIPVWKQVVSSLFSWHTALSVGITVMTIYGKEIGQFIVNLFRGGEAARIAATKVEAMNKAFESAEYGKAIKDLAELRTVIKSAQDGVVSKERALKVYNDVVGKTAGQLKTFNDLEKWQIDNEKAYLQLMYRKAQAQAFLQVAVEKTVEAQKKALEGPGFGDYAQSFLSGFGTNLDAGATLFNQVGINASFKMSAEMMKLFEEAQLSAQKFAKENGLNFFADEKSLKSAKAKIYDTYKALMSDIRALDSEYARQVMPDDAAELRALDEKFAKIREKVAEFNKSAGSKLRIDLEWFDGIHNDARQNLQYVQASDQLAERYKKDYELYKQYEEDKKELGEAFANESAGGNLTRIKSFYKELNDEVDRLRAKISDRTATDVEIDRFYKLNPIVQQMQDDDLEALRSSYQEALKLSETFFTKEQAIRKKYQDAFAELEKNKTKISKEELEERTKVLKQGLNDDLKALIESAPEYKEAMNAIDKSGRWMLADAFRNGKDIVYKLIDGLKSATNSERTKLKAIFGDFFNTGMADATRGNYQSIVQLVDGFGHLVEGSFQFRDNIDGGLGALSNMVTTAGKLAETLGNALGKAGEGLSTAGAAGAIAGALLSVGSAISTGFNQARQQANAEAQKQFEYQNERQLRVTEAVTKALERQLELLNEIYGADRLSKYAESLSTIEKNWQDINNQLDGRFMLTNDTFTNDILRRLNNGETAKQIQKSFPLVSVEFWKVDDILKNLGRFTQFSKLPDDITKAREELAKLQYQADLGNVDDYTRQLIDQLQAQLDMYEETANRLREENTGNAFSSILNDVKSLFQNSGEDSATAWSKGFSKILDNYIMQKFSREYLEKAMQDWYTMLDQYADSDGGIDDEERKALQQAWEKIRQDGEQRVKDIQNAMGYDPAVDNRSTLSSSGIDRITEQSASELIGLYRGHYDLTKQILLIIQFGQEGFVQSLRHQAAIEQNTADTVTELKSAVTELKAINKNTGGRYGG